MRAPDRSNRSHLAPRPRPLVGRSGKPAARSIPAREGGATHRQQEAAAATFPPGTVGLLRASGRLTLVNLLLSLFFHVHSCGITKN